MQSEISPSLRSNDNLTVIPGDRRLLGPGSSVEVLKQDVPFSHRFLDKDPETSKARPLYFKVVIGVLVLALTYVIWGVLPIYWASVFDLYNHAHNLRGWVVVSCVWFYLPVPFLKFVVAFRILMGGQWARRCRKHLLVARGRLRK